MHHRSTRVEHRLEFYLIIKKKWLNGRWLINSGNFAARIYSVFVYLYNIIYFHDVCLYKGNEFEACFSATCSAGVFGTITNRLRFGGFRTFRMRCTFPREPHTRKVKQQQPSTAAATTTTTSTITKKTIEFSAVLQFCGSRRMSLATEGALFHT